MSGLFGGGSSTPKYTTTTQTATNAPWSGAVPSINQSLAGASSVYGSDPFARYNTGEIAPLNGYESGGIGSLFGYGETPNAAFAGGALNTGLNTAQNLAQGGTSYGTATPAYGAALNGIGSLTSGYTPGVAGNAYNTGLQAIGTLGSGSGVNAASGAFGDSEDMLSKTLSGGYLNPSSNPGLQSTINQALATAVPAATQSFTGGNRSDSGLASLAQATAADNTVGNIEYQNYAQERQNQLAAASQANTDLVGQQGVQSGAAGLGLEAQANQNATAAQGASLGLNAQAEQNQTALGGGALAGNLYGAGLSGLTSALGAGQTLQGYDQSATTAGVNQYNSNLLAQLNNLQAFNQNLSGSGALGFGSSSGTGSTPYFQNGTASSLAGLAGGVGLLNGLGNLGGNGATLGGIFDQSGALSGIGNLALGLGSWFG